jgi:hypothetical protein
LDLQRFGPAPAHLPGDPAAARAEQERRRAPWNIGGPQMAIQRDIAIALPDRALTVRLYVPKLPAEGLVLYLHGGGWAIGSLDTHDRLTRALAAASGLAFLGIGYRKAPEHPYPAALEDTLDVCDWLAANPDILGFPVRMDRLGVAGDSAGALYQLVDGAVILTDADGAEEVLRPSGGKPVFIDPLPYFTGVPQPRTARAKTSVIAVAIDPRSREAVVRNFPQLTLDLLRQHSGA